MRRFLLLFLPLLVFVVALTAPGGESSFQVGPPAEARPSLASPYVAWRGGAIYLYSGPYTAWRYPGLVAVDVKFPGPVQVWSDCGFIPPMGLEGPGPRLIDVEVPPGWQGQCRLNMTAPGWRWSAVLVVRQVDWWPSATRVAVVLNGSGWQFLQVSEDGTLYVWERPLASLPLAGCVAAYGGSVLIPEELPYAPVDPSVRPAPLVPAASGVRRYGFLVYVNGTATVYIYPAPCPAAASAPSAPPPNLADYVFGVYIPTAGGYVLDAPSWRVAYRDTPLRRLAVANGTASKYAVYAYWYGTPVGMWGGVIRYRFAVEPLLTTGLIYVMPINATGPVQVGPGVWIYRAHNFTVWVAGPEAPAQLGLRLPRGLPYGWLEPFYVVIDGTGRWGGWPTVVSVKLERLS